MTATEQQIRDQAAALVRQLDAIANGALIGSRAARLTQIVEGVEVLRAWIGDDRPHTTKTTATAPKRTTGDAR